MFNTLTARDSRGRPARHRGCDPGLLHEPPPHASCVRRVMAQTLLKPWNSRCRGSLHDSRPLVLSGSITRALFLAHLESANVTTMTHEISRAAAVLMLLPTLLSAQVRDRPARSKAANDVTTLSRGWSALAEGRAEVAIRAASDVLARRPWDHHALALKIEALSGSDPLRALDTYEQWLGDRADDIGLLEPVPRAALQQIAATSDPDLRRAALKALADAHVDGSETTGTSGAGAQQDQLAQDLEAARSGDAAAIERLQIAARSDQVRDKTELARALTGAGPVAVPLLMPLLQSRNGPDRAAAAQALGKLKAAEARSELQRLLQDQDPFVRSSAAVALARMNDPQGQTIVDQLLASPVPDLQLMAAEAWDGRDGPWVSVVTPLLENQNGLIRVQAARLIAPVNPELARRTLQRALQDSNPVIRAESARVASEVAGEASAAAVPQLRKSLRDRDATVRLYAATALLTLARAAH